MQTQRKVVDGNLRLGLDLPGKPSQLLDPRRPLLRGTLAAEFPVTRARQKDQDGRLGGYLSPEALRDLPGDVFPARGCDGGVSEAIEKHVQGSVPDPAAPGPRLHEAHPNHRETLTIDEPQQIDTADPPRRRIVCPDRLDANLVVE